VDVNEAGTMHNDPNRRAVMACLAATLAPTPGLAEVVRLCPSDPTISNAEAPLTIDTHAHFFNGSDLQIQEFLSQTTVGPDSELYPLVKGTSGFLQALAWHLAPGAKAEVDAISRYAARMSECGGADQMRRAAGGAYQEGYALGRRELQATANVLNQTRVGADVLAPKPGQAGLGAAIADLPETYDAFEERRADGATVLGSQPTFLGYIQFVLHNFNHRHVNAIDYLTTYSKGSSRKIDLVVASMVDYDWWLARGRATPTPLQEQVDVMSQVSVLLGGRVHGFAPFCPFREAMTLDSSGTGDAMRLVKSAIETRGFIGVKLYPPMGFAPWGNTGKTVWQGKPSLPAAAADPDFGKRLDAAMNSLFTYCLANDVPIMAHTNHSNGPYEEFKDLAGSENWKLALDKFPGLRVSFGHFGDADLAGRHSGREYFRRQRLLRRHPDQPGQDARCAARSVRCREANPARAPDVRHRLDDDPAAEECGALPLRFHGRHATHRRGRARHWRAADNADKRVLRPQCGGVPGSAHRLPQSQAYRALLRTGQRARA
jgi:hypothetical protein